MKRTVVMVGLALLAGLGAGYTLGIHRPVTPATPVVSPPTASGMPASAPAPASVASAPIRSPGASPTVEEAKRKLAVWIAAGSPKEERQKVTEYLALWSASDPAAALDFVFNAPRFPWRNGALVIPLTAICRRDPAQVANWLRGHLPESDCGDIASHVISELFQDSPREALALAEADGFGVDRQYFGMILAELVRTSPNEALAAFARLSEGGRSGTATMIAAAWATTDLAAALRWAASLAGSPAGEEAKRGIVYQLARTKPTQALELLRQHNLPVDTARSITLEIARRQPELILRNLSLVTADLQTQAFSVAAAESFATEPDRIVTLARNSGLPPDKAGEVIGDAWSRWLNQDRMAAEAWADTVQDPVLRTQIELLKLRDVANTDPTLFLSSVASQPSAQAEKQLIQSALSSITPLQAGDWIALHPGLVDPSFAAQIATRYFNWNREQASAWVGRLPPGEARNRSLAGLALSWGETGDTTKASASLGAIADSHLQTSTRFQVFNTLYRKDPASAVQWLGTQPVSPEIRSNWEALADATPPPDAIFHHYD